MPIRQTTGVWTALCRRILEAADGAGRVVFCLVAAGAMASAEPAMRGAPNPGAVPVDQWVIAGNACGPAALLNALRFGGPSWQRAAAGVLGETDRGKLSTIIRTWGLKPSASLPGRTRWGRDGVNVDDLRDIANDLGRPQLLPKMGSEVLVLRAGETPAKLLARTHARVAGSLRKGLPPVLSIRRIARVGGKAGAGWEVIQGHYVTVISAPVKLQAGAESFPVSYVDPWGGRRAEGRIAISSQAFLSGDQAEGGVAPCLEAAFPEAEVGRKRVKAGQQTLVVASGVIGIW